MGTHSGIWSWIWDVFRNMDINTLTDRCMVYIVATIHLAMIILNLAAVPFLVAYEPFYIWMPLITFLVSPLVGGTYCMFNRLENYYREQAGMPLIHDRVGQIYEIIKRKLTWQR